MSSASPLRLYAPFVALAAAQLVVVAVAGGGGSSENVGAALPGLRATGAAAPLNRGIAGSPDDVRRGAAASQAGSAAGSEAVAAPGSDLSGRAGGAEDTSHCVNGRQSDITYYSPPCRPLFTGDNGGETYPGVTATEIRVVEFQCQSNEQVDAILATQGLAATPAEQAALRDAAVRYINEKYELYGRQIVVEPVLGDCVVSPPDPARDRQAAEEVARKDPFIVIDMAGGPSRHDVWAREGIISIGGSWQTAELYEARRPFRWDVNMSGSETAETIAEYYCKKLADTPATNAGVVIHRSVPGGRAAPRQLGIVSLDNGNGVHLPNAERVRDLVESCTDTSIPIFTYPSDVSRATEISRVIVAGLIDAKVTTVLCNCDPIAPVFFTQDMTKNQYFPEHIVTGAGLLDFEKLARTYDRAQWSHAFGLSQQTDPLPVQDTDVGRVWRYAQSEGSPCSTCELRWQYYAQIGDMLHLAGPMLDPQTVETGLFGTGPRGGWTGSGGDSTRYLLQYGIGDHNGISDSREVYWSPSAISAADGQAGTYVSIDAGRRFRQGELTNNFTVPAAPS